MSVCSAGASYSLVHVNETKMPVNKSRKQSRYTPPPPPTPSISKEGKLMIVITVFFVFIAMVAVITCLICRNKTAQTDESYIKNGTEDYSMFSILNVPFERNVNSKVKLYMENGNTEEGTDPKTIEELKSLIHRL